MRYDLRVSPVMFLAESRLRLGQALSLLVLVFTCSVWADEAQVFLSTDFPQGRENTPIPNDENLVFYVQRSLNKNTVVYIANILDSGDIHTSAPLSVHWRRFAKDGALRDLTFTERRLAFGVDIKPDRSRAQSFTISINSYPDRKATLRIGENGKPVALMKLGKHQTRLIYAYVVLEEASKIPNVRYVDVVGEELTTGKFVRERIFPQPKASSGNTDFN